MRCMGKFSSAKIIMMLFQCTIHPIFILLSMWQDYVHFLYFFALKILSFLHIKNRHIWYIFLKLDFFLWNQKYNVLYCIVYCKHRTKYANENKNETTNIKIRTLYKYSKVFKKSEQHKNVWRYLLYIMLCCIDCDATRSTRTKM